MYADARRQLHTAGSLIVFGAEKFKRAKIISGLNTLKECNKALQQNLSYDKIGFAREFVFDYLIDCIRILIFFEGYMKAELIAQNFCVHNISHDGPLTHLKPLANQQKKRPVTLDEIQAIEPFIIDTTQEVITHAGLKETTLGINILLGSKYRSHYQFDDSITESIVYFNNIRNKLHFNHSADFQLSTHLIERIEQLNEFVDTTIKRWIKPRSA